MGEHIWERKVSWENRSKSQVEQPLWKDEAEKNQTTALVMCSAYQNNPGEIVLNFVTALLRTLLGHSAYPEPLAGEVLRRNGQAHLQAWNSSCVKGSQIAPRDQVSS